MSPEDVELLQNSGEAFLENIGLLVTSSVLYGLYLAIFAFGLRALKRQRRTKNTWLLFGFLFILFLFSTANLVVQIAFNVDLIRGALIDNPNAPFIDRVNIANDSINVLGTCQIWFGTGGGGLLSVFADMVVVWRAFVLWPGNRVVKTLLVSLTLANFGIAIASSTMYTILAASPSAVISTISPTGIMLSLSQFLSLAINVLAIILIGYKAYEHRRAMKAIAGSQGFMAGSILYFLTESGVAFCVVQIIAISTSMTDNTSHTALDYATGLWQQFTNFAAAVYPILVLIIVDVRRSISDYTGEFADSKYAEESNEQSLGVGTHISFADRPRKSSSSGVGKDGIIESCIDLPDPTRHSEDLEKGEHSMEVGRVGHVYES